MVPQLEPLLIVSNYETQIPVSIIETMKKSLYTKENKALCDWLSSKRHESGLSIRALAVTLGIHHSIVGKIETGQRRLDVVEYLRYCRALNIDPHEGINHTSKHLK